MEIELKFHTVCSLAIPCSPLCDCLDCSNPLTSRIFGCGVLRSLWVTVDLGLLTAVGLLCIRGRARAMGVMRAWDLGPLGVAYTGLIRNTWAFFSMWLKVCVSECARVTRLTESCSISLENSTLRFSSRFVICCTIMAACSESEYDLFTCSMSLLEVVLCRQCRVRCASCLVGIERVGPLIPIFRAGPKIALRFPCLLVYIYIY